jgi:hypothetical protein
MSVNNSKDNSGPVVNEGCATEQSAPCKTSAGTSPDAERGSATKPDNRPRVSVPAHSSMVPAGNRQVIKPR